jgi:hydroxyethylthiazole kinase-like uncharacterized protein yjeF
LLLDEELSSREFRALDMNAEYLGVSPIQLMENAGRAVAEAVMERFKPGCRVVVVCGPGGNGGDGFVAARHLAGAGYKVEVILATARESIRNEEARANLESITRMRSSMVVREARSPSQLEEIDADVVVDALLGTGSRVPLSSPFLEAVQAMNRSGGFKVAVDLPSGMDSDTGAAPGEAFRADLTVTFHKPKAGFRRGRALLGELVVSPIGIPPEAELFAGPGDVYLASRVRPPDSKKGDFGYLLVVGGSETYSGAPALTALGAYHAGVDLVYVAAPETAASIIASYSPALVTIKLKGGHLSPRSVEELRPHMERVDALAVGPGLGLNEDTVKAVETLIECAEELGLPLLLDADGIKAYSRAVRRLKTSAVLTPHSGEFKILTGREAPAEIWERGRVVEEEAGRLGAVILLKGHIDVISDGIHTRYNLTGNPGMTVGGTGDVLSGIVSGLMAMGCNPYEAAVAGAFINGAAGDAVYEEKGFHILPTDLLEKIPRIMEEALTRKLRAREMGQ